MLSDSGSIDMNSLQPSNFDMACNCRHVGKLFKIGASQNFETRIPILKEGGWTNAYLR